ncbi:UV excision repair protein rhp23 [Aspergillus terreus]|uniref:UV excision repair protein RAD23 n=1 Tax=Aspergillus terreus TaxID=33178 RepID=A0A5M3ZIB9_ASPTE|nr:hypothetical protein ATETN484_0018006800 [Aspergillus terreus]GFF14947.1 UV excision repair protein rhp23 [Aspergillus terreus]
MKLTFKDLKQEKFEIDAEPSETVGQVKERICQLKGWEVPQLKLIYSGKILKDENTIESYKVEEKGFIVYMVSKPKTSSSSAAPSQGPSTPSRAAASTPAAPPAPAPATSAPAQAAPPATPSPAATGASQSGSAFNDPSALMTGRENENAVAQMESMGFARDDINRAMRAAFFNPDRAVEYLLSGIPDNIQQEQQQQQQQQAAAAAAASPTPQAPSGESGLTTAGGDEPVNLFEAAAQAGTQDTGRAGRSGGEALPNLDFLRHNPHFQQLRQLVQQNPQMLEPILQQLASGNPQIAALIGQNEEQFLQLLSEEDEEGALPPGTHQIHVTEEERDAIERLCRLGFSRDSVIQAYFACDKNEELAANYLFENPDDPEDQ